MSSGSQEVAVAYSLVAVVAVCALEAEVEIDL
jgi:hypothetical protein